MASENDDDTEYVQEEDTSDKRRARNTSMVWNHFKKLSGGIARCNHCRKALSFKTSVTNLKKHLCGKHPEFVEQRSDLATKNYLFTHPSRKNTSHHNCYKRKKGRSWTYSDADDDISPNNTQVLGDTTVKFSSEIWRHFEQDQDEDEAKCSLCQESVPSNLDEMKNHLEEHHTSLLDEIIAKVQKSQDDSESNALEEENIYTEVLYLEDESGNKLNYFPKKRKITRSSRQESTHENRVKYEKKISVIPDDPILKANVPVQDDLDVFLSYIRSLLKRIPKVDSPKLHYDIINLIRNTEFKGNLQNSVAETVALDNSFHDNVTSLLDKHVIIPQNGTSTGNVNIIDSQKITVQHILASQNDETE